MLCVLLEGGSVTCAAGGVMVGEIQSARWEIEPEARELQVTPCLESQERELSGFLHTCCSFSMEDEARARRQRVCNQVPFCASIRGSGARN